MSCKESKEIWKPVVGYEEHYEVSNKGRVRSIDRYITFKDGRVVFYKSQLLKPSLEGPEKNQKFSVCLYKDGKSRFIKVHHLVGDAFIGPRPDGMEVCHGENGPFDNSLDNIRYDTREENIKDKYRHRKMDKDKKLRKLSVNDVEKIKELLKKGLKHREIAEMFNVSKSAVTHINTGYTWTLLEEVE